MIRSYRSRDTERLFHRERPRAIPHELHRAALRKLRMLHRARSLEDLRVPPGNRLERLSGDRKGEYSIRINDCYRLCFRRQSGDAFDVEIVDYH